MKVNVLCVPEDYRHADGQERIFLEETRKLRRVVIPKSILVLK